MELILAVLGAGPIGYFTSTCRKRPDGSAARSIASGAVYHRGPAVKRTASILWRALGEAGAMCLVTPPPERKDTPEHKR